MEYKLENDLLEVKVSAHGAELQSIKNKRTGYEYLWQGDPAFWKRRSPVLFPIVGAVWNGEFHMDGKTYKMGQHGFARDMDFTLIEDTPDDQLWFRLDSTPQMLEQYPRPFRLEIGYHLIEARLTVYWKVINTGDSDMSYQIGAHPAFNLPDFNPADEIHGYFAFNHLDTTLIAEKISEQGCVGDETQTPELTPYESLLPIKADTFINDALIFGGKKINRVSLMDKGRQPWLTLLFDTPYVGLWSPRPDAPFVCIEPWYGRADHVGYTGDFADRHAVNTLAPHDRFLTFYHIIIDNI